MAQWIRHHASNVRIASSSLVVGNILISLTKLILKIKQLLSIYMFLELEKRIINHQYTNLKDDTKIWSFAKIDDKTTQIMVVY